MALVTLTTFLAAMMPIRPARADISPNPPLDPGMGAGGPPSLAEQPPLGSTGQALATVDAATGEARSTFAFELPTARGQAQPELALNYASSSGLGFAGIGWSLDTPSIERRGSSGMPRFDDDVLGQQGDLSDNYTFGGAQLVPICTIDGNGHCSAMQPGSAGGGPAPEQFPPDVAGWTYFRTEIDNGMRFFYDTVPGDALFGRTWKVQTKGGVSLTFGQTNDAFVQGAHPIEVAHDPLAISAPVTTVNSSPHVFRWNLSRQTDTSGNTVFYVWDHLQGDVAGGVDPTQDQGREYLIDIYDTPPTTRAPKNASAFAHHVHLTWSAPDSRESLFSQSPSWREPPALHLEHVDVTSSPWLGGTRQLVRRYWLDYESNDAKTQVRLAAIHLEGTCNQWAEGIGGLLPATSCPKLLALKMTYTPPGQVEKHVSWMNLQLKYGPVYPGPYLLVDADGDSLPEMYASNGNGIPIAPDPSMQRQAQVGDLFGQPNVVSRFAIGDWLGDGQSDWLWFDITTSGTNPHSREFYSLGHEQGCVGCAAFLGVGPIDAPIPPYTLQPDFQTGRALDIDGDGLTDMAFVPDSAGGTSFLGYFTARDLTGHINPVAWHSSASTCPNRRMWGIPALYSSHATQRVLADADGDGLADIVVLENVDYPGAGSQFGLAVAHVFKNRGDGRFGTAPGSATPDCAEPGYAHQAYDDYEIQFPMASTGIDNFAFSSTGSVSLHDVDGDGLADFVWIDSTGLNVAYQRWYANTQTFGFAGPTNLASLEALGCNATPAPDGIHNFDQTEVSVQFADMNASGTDDIVAFVCGFMGWFDLHGAAQGQPHQRPGLLQTISNGAGATTTLTYAILGDLQGPNAIVGGPSIAHPAAVPVPVEVVTSIASSNGLQGPYAQSSSTTYTYDYPVYDARDRAFLGFQTVKTSRQGDMDASGKPVSAALDTTTHFVIGACAVQPAQGCAATKAYGWHMQRGLPGVIEQQDASNGDAGLTTTVNTYDYGLWLVGANGVAIWRVSLAQTDEYLWDQGQTGSPTSFNVLQSPSGSFPQFVFAVGVSLPNGNTPNGSGGATRLEQQFVQDAYGNVSDVIDYGQRGQDPIIDMHTDWAAGAQVPGGDATGWHWRPVTNRRSYVDSSLTPTSPMREVDFTYDASGRGLLATMSAPLHGTVPLDRRNPGGQVAPTPPDASQDTASGQGVTLLTVGYDAFGNLNQVTGPNGQCAQVVYDPVFTELPAAIRRFRGGCGVDPLFTLREYDRGLERITEELSPSIHLMTAEYDAFGRMTALYQPDPENVLQTSPNPVVQIDYSKYDNQSPVRKLKVSRLVGAGVSHNVPYASYRTEWQYFDGLGDLLVDVGESETSQWVVSGAHQVGTHTGRALQSWRPFFASIGDGSLYDVQSASPGGAASAASYDALGRVTSSKDEKSRQSFATYHPLSTVLQDAEQASGGHQGASTTLQYDGRGRLIAAVAALPNLFKQEGTPADVVTTAYQYLASGEVTNIRKTNSTGQFYERTIDYDSLGRMVRQFEPNTSSEVISLSPPSERFYDWRYAYNDSGELVGTSDPRGCGKNLQYDKLGRLLGEDYSPCDAQYQLAYSEGHYDTGVGLEAWYRYDAPETLAQHAFWYNGYLTATYDRGQHSRVTLDGRGRVTSVARQIATIEGTGTYAPHWFERQFSYDEINRVTEATTGADVPELLTAGTSVVRTDYALRGGVGRVRTTYGDGHLLDSRTFWPSGAPDVSIYGDASHVQEASHYDIDGTLDEYQLTRSNGPWIPKSAAYQPPASDDMTMAGDLLDLKFGYDNAYNPTSITDGSQANWPDGMKASLKTLGYDDAYRLVSVGTSYGTHADSFTSPYLPELQKGDGSFPVLHTENVKTRVLNQTFAYDFLDNIVSSDDDQHDSPDRSFGAATYGLTGPIFATPNRMLSAMQGGTNIAVSYDGAGNTSGVTVTQTAPCEGPCVTQYAYMWDEVGRLQLAVRAEGDTESSTRFRVGFAYVYDASGARVLRQEVNDATPTKNGYDVNVFGTLRLEGASPTLDGNGDYERSAATEIVYLQDGAGQTYGRAFYAQQSLPLSSSGAVHVFMEFGDHLGSTSAVIDHDTGELVERPTYLAYGAPDADGRTDRWSDFREAYRYTGHDDDAQVGLSYFGARYYIPTLGRFASPDPLTIHALSSQMNPYGFVSGSPLANVDPLGLDDDPTSGYGPPGCDNLSGGCGGGPTFSFGGDGMVPYGGWGPGGPVPGVGTSAPPASGTVPGTVIAPNPLTPWSAAGSSAATSAPPGLRDPGHSWFDPRTGDVRWNPNAGSSAALLLGTSRPVTAFEESPELEHAVGVVGPHVLNAVPVLGPAIVILNPNTPLAAKGIAAAGIIVPFAGEFTGEIAAEGASLLAGEVVTETSAAASSAVEATEALAAETQRRRGSDREHSENGSSSRDTRRRDSGGRRCDRLESRTACSRRVQGLAPSSPPRGRRGDHRHPTGRAAWPSTTARRNESRHMPGLQGSHRADRREGHGS